MNKGKKYCNYPPQPIIGLEPKPITVVIDLDSLASGASL
jgi:hypothetical protein